MNRTMSDERESRWKKKSIFLLSALVVFAVVGIPLASVRFPLGLAVYLAGLIAATALLIRWHLHNTAFSCGKCGHAFTPSAASFCLSPHMGFRKLLTCPSCNESSWCQAMSRDAVDATDGRTVSAKPAGARPNRSLYVQTALVLAVYVILWVNTLVVYPLLPETIPIHFNLALEPDGWGSQNAIFLLPLVAALLPLTHATICLFAARHGYRSRVYGFITGLMIFFLLVFVGLEYLTLANSGVRP